jgi:hypothetical protein
MAKINKYDVAAIAATNDLEGDEYQKIPASKQRELFGANILGRKSVNFEGDNQGTVRIMESKAFGTDCQVTRMSYEQFADMINDSQG